MTIKLHLSYNMRYLVIRDWGKACGICKDLETINTFSNLSFILKTPISKDHF